MDTNGVRAGARLRSLRKWLLSALLLALLGCGTQHTAQDAREARDEAGQQGSTTEASARSADRSSARRAQLESPEIDEVIAAPATEAELEGVLPAAPPVAVASGDSLGVSTQAAAEPAPSYEPKHKAESKVGTGSLGVIGTGAGAGGYGNGRARAFRRHDMLRNSYTRKRALAPAARVAPAQDFDTEAYAHIAEHGFTKVKDSPLSTFSIDVDTASYSNVRRMLRDGQLPPADAVRIEEMINYFRYDYAKPSGNAPVSVTTEVAAAPWAPSHRLVQVGLRARDLVREQNVPRNLVFLVDVSGSMQDPDKLPLLKQGLSLLARELEPRDRISIVVYAGASGLALPPTSGGERGTILNALSALEAGGSTNGADGIELAYRVAQSQFIAGGINRVILATDGDFNVGVTSHGELVRLIEDKRKSGVFLTVLGFGTGNLKDATMEQLADKGNGNYAYIDSIDEANKVLVREAGATLVTVAKDVKLQIEWNPARVASYRLIGYENRKLEDRDFNDDTKDAGEMGAGHTVTALYDVTLVGEGSDKPEVDPLRYQSERVPSAAAGSGELLTVKLRYKTPTGTSSELITKAVVDSMQRAPWHDLGFAAAVAGFGMLLRDSEHKGQMTLEMVRDLASRALEKNQSRERRELIELMDSAKRLGLGG